jgi:transcriptional regulator with XRE-family HTH domain
MGERVTRLALWRAEQDWTLAEVADLVGVSPSMLSRAERGERHLSPALRVQISRRLGVAVGDLFPVEELDVDAETVP